MLARPWRWQLLVAQVAACSIGSIGSIGLVAQVAACMWVKAGDATLELQGMPAGQEHRVLPAAASERMAAAVQAWQPSGSAAEGMHLALIRFDITPTVLRGLPTSLRHLELR